MQSVITHYDTFIHSGCKVPWALRGGTGSAASAEALTGTYGLLCTHKTQIPVRTENHSQRKMLMIFCPLAGRKLCDSPCLSTLNSADFIVGTGDARSGRDGCDDCDDRIERCFLSSQSSRIVALTVWMG